MIGLETERLIIREHEVSDLEAHHRLISNDEVMYFIQDIKTNSIQETKDNLEFAIEQSRLEKRTCYFFAVVEKNTNDHIGSVGFTILDNESGGNAELGYFIHKQFWGKGFTTEAVKAVIEYGFETVGLKKITTGCVYDNQSSEHIMKKMGMFKEAHKYHHISIDGVWRDRVEYGLYNKSLLTTSEKQRLLIATLAESLRYRKYHFDGSTAAFVYGVECEMDDIDITFPYEDEMRIREHFKEYKLTETVESEGFKHFHFYMNNEKIHCLFYEGDSKQFSFEDDIMVLYDTPIVYKSMSFFLRHSNNQMIIDAVKRLQQRNPIT
jgi:ribosomal-protein-alanine N-acetyltransferase